MARIGKSRVVEVESEDGDLAVETSRSSVSQSDLRVLLKGDLNNVSFTTKGLVLWFKGKPQ